MTGRTDARAVFQPTYACNPDTDALQIELRFVTWQNHDAGGWICVRTSFDNSHEFRYSPPGNTRTLLPSVVPQCALANTHPPVVDPNRECIKVTLVVIPTDGTSVSSTTLSTSTVSSTSTTSTTSTSTSTSTTSTTSTSTSTSTSSSSTSTGTPTPGGGVGLYTDLTASGWRFLGCSPEERWTTDGAFRTLSGAMESLDTMTNQECIAFCGARGFKYAGSEWRRECWCGASFAATRAPKTTVASLALCNYKCTGDQSQNCGGDAWLSLYEKCAAGAACVNQVFT